jgi:hypothetical protein
MTMDANTRSGLALNQNIALEQIFKARHPDGFFRFYDREYSRASRFEQYKLTGKQWQRAYRSLTARRFVEYSSDKRCYVLTIKGFRAVVDNAYITSGPMGPLTGQYRIPKKDTLTSYIWAVLRTKNIATIEDILAIMPIEPEDYDKSYDTARRIVYWLCKTQIVRKLPHKKKGTHLTSPGFNRYQLMIDFGPKHPIIRQRKHQVYDPNSQTNVPFKEVLKVFKDRIN